MSYDPFTHTVSPQPEASKNGNGRRAAIVVSAVVAVAIVVLGVIGTIWMLNRDEGVPVVAASPSPTPEID